MPNIAWTVGSLLLLLDNQPNALLKSVDGGAIGADVVSDPARSGQTLPAKRLGPIRYDEVVVETGLDMGAALRSWLTRACAGEAPLAQAAVAVLDGEGTVRAIRRFDDARLTQVAFPALDTGSKDPASVRLHLRADQIRTESPDGNAAFDLSGLRNIKWPASAYSLSIDGIERAATAVKIDSLGFKQPIFADPVGPDKSPAAIGPLSFSDLRITVPEQLAAPWLAWHEDAVIKGNSGSSAGRSGQIGLLDPATRQPVSIIELHNLGISRLVPLRQEQGTVVRYAVELYYERLNFASPA